MNSLVVQHGILRSDVDTLRNVVASLQSTLEQRADSNISSATAAASGDGTTFDTIKEYCDKRLDEHQEQVQNSLNDMVKRFEALEATMHSLESRFENHTSKKCFK